jgi:Uma2 family endonuclease
VDVSDTTLANDRGTKPLAYARAGIPAYWIVNLTNRRVERNTNPSSSGYRLSESIAEDGVIPFEVDGQEQGRIAIAGLFLRG